MSNSQRPSRQCAKEGEAKRRRTDQDMNRLEQYVLGGSVSRQPSQQEMYTNRGEIRVAYVGANKRKEMPRHF